MLGWLPLDWQLQHIPWSQASQPSTKPSPGFAMSSVFPFSAQILTLFLLPYLLDICSSIITEFIPAY